MDPKQCSIGIQLHRGAAPDRIVVLIRGSISLLDGGHVSQRVVNLYFEYVYELNTAEAVPQPFAFVPREWCALVQYDPVWELHASVEEELANGLADTPCVVPRHERIASPDDRVFDLAESVLKPLAARAVDVAASEHNVVTPLGSAVDAESEPNKGCVIREIVK